MVTVPKDADPQQRAWRQLMHHVGLAESTPMPRQVVGLGAGPVRTESEPQWAPRPRPSPSTMRSEAPRGTERR
jgi:hypothetical protein